MKYLSVLCTTAFILSLASNSLAAEPQISFWYGSNQEFGSLGNPQRWVNIIGNVSDEDGVASFSYSLNGGPDTPLSLGPDARRLLAAGDFNLEIDYLDLKAGDNRIEFRATDSTGERAVRRVTIAYTPGNIWPDNYSIEWENVTAIQGVVQVIDGLWSYGADGVRPQEIGYERIIGFGDLAWTNYEITVPVTIQRIDASAYDATQSAAPRFGITMRWRGHSDWSNIEGFEDWTQPRVGTDFSGASAWYEWPDRNEPQNTRLYISGNGGQDIAPSAQTIDFGATYLQKMRCETLPDGRTEYRLKLWPADSTEPAAWDIIHYETNGVAAGSVILVAHHVDVTFGDVSITTLPDNTPPLVQNVRFELDGSDGILTWQTSKPARSQINYGLSEQYETGQVTNDSLLLTHRAELNGLAANVVYQYNIRVEDRNGNVGNSGNLWFSTSLQPPDIVSDHFNSPQLDPGIWSVIDPLSDAEFSMNGKEAVIYVSEGTEHDAWGTGSDFGNTLPRIMQAVHNVDFDLAVKFNSPVERPYQHQGIVIEQNKDNLLRFEFRSDGNGVRLFLAEIVNGVATLIRDRNVAGRGTAPLYARVQREGTVWTFLYSFDGTTWQTTTSLNRGLTMTGIGLSLANSSATGHMLRADYFHNLNDLPDNVPPDRVAPQIAEVTVDTDAEQATVSWRANEPGVGTVAYGTSADNLSMNVATDTLSIWNSVALTNLDSLTNYFFAITTEDANGNTATFDGYQFRTGGTEPANIISDSFSGQQLNSELWEVVNPLADATIDVNGRQLTIDMPGLSGHNVAGTGPDSFVYTLPRITQTTNDGNFEIEAKFDSPLTLVGQRQGLVVEQDDLNLLICEFFCGGAETKLSVISVKNGVADSVINTAIGEARIAPQFMRLGRTGSRWLVQYSLDGSTWLQAGTFSVSMEVGTVGVHAGTSAGSAHTAVIDHFYNTSAISQDIEPPIISEIEILPGKTEAVVRWLTSELTSADVQFGLDTTYSSGLPNDSLLLRHEVVLVGLDSVTDHHARIVARDASGNAAISADLTFRTGGQEPTILQTDHFTGASLNTDVWTFINPKDDATLEIRNGEARISVAAESTHDTWGDNQSPYKNTVPRIQQLANNVNFDVEAKYNSTLVAGFQQQGILVEENERTLLRFEFYSNGNNIFIFAANIRDGIGQVLVNESIAAPGQSPLYIAVKRRGNSWTQSYSLNGMNWNIAAEFSAVLNVTAVSAHVGNSGVALTGRLDHFKVIQLATGVESAEKQLPVNFALNPNFPNPFNISTTLVLDIPASADHIKNGSLTIYNSRGERVRVLRQGIFTPGTYRIQWAGQASDGKIVASGVYYGVFSAPGYRAVRRMLLLK